MENVGRPTPPPYQIATIIFIAALLRGCSHITQHKNWPFLKPPTPYVTDLVKILINLYKRKMH